jgi:hypothetical protein
MARNSRHFWKAGLFAVAAVTVALPPALASMTRADRIRDTQLSNSVLGQFTPASGDPRLIARYIKISEEARRGFSFTPALPDDGHKNRAITVVIRATIRRAHAPPRLPQAAPNRRSRSPP